MTDLSKLAEVYSTAVLHKAEVLTETGGLARDEQHPSVFWARGSAGNRYRLQVVEPFDEDEVIGEVDTAEVLPYITCTCPNGLNASGSAHCYHAAAVVGILLAEGDEP